MVKLFGATAACGTEERVSDRMADEHTSFVKLSSTICTLNEFFLFGLDEENLLEGVFVDTQLIADLDVIRCDLPKAGLAVVELEVTETMNS
jgi:hypothetical protein